MDEQWERWEETRGRARAQRREPTKAESVLWRLVRRRQLDGFRFRRQHPLGPFIADFYCRQARLVVELDGPVHDDPERSARDEAKRAFLEARDLVVLRFTNDEVLHETTRTIARLRHALHTS